MNGGKTIVIECIIVGANINIDSFVGMQCNKIFYNAVIYFIVEEVFAALPMDVISTADMQS